MIEIATYIYYSENGIMHTVTLEVEVEHGYPYLLEFFQEYLAQPRASKFEVKRRPPYGKRESFKGEKVLSLSNEILNLGGGHTMNVINRKIVVR